MAAPDTFDDIHELLKKSPGLSSTIGMEKSMTFIRLATRLKDEILSKQKPSHDPSKTPETLPENVRDFLGKAINIPDGYVQGCWDTFGRTVWERDVNGDSVGADSKLFKQFGLDNLLCEPFIHLNHSLKTRIDQQHFSN
jgi:hypothetical protein